MEDEELIIEETSFVAYGAMFESEAWSCGGRLRAIKPAQVWLVPPAYPGTQYGRLAMSDMLGCRK